MNLLGTLARWYIPSFLKKWELRRLFKITGEAFGVVPPPAEKMSLQELLDEYALFTRYEVERVGDAIPQCDRIKKYLFDHAFQIGLEYKSLFGITSSRDAMYAARIMYRILGIDFQGWETGEIEIRSCLFGRYYSSRTCRIISALDAGLLAGLSGGGRLEFMERMTEGGACCRARLIGGEGAV